MLDLHLQLHSQVSIPFSISLTNTQCPVLLTVKQTLEDCKDCSNFLSLYSNSLFTIFKKKIDLDLC